MKKSTFRKIYDKLPAQKVVAPKTEWIKRMADICKVHPTTVRCWLADSPCLVATVFHSQTFCRFTHTLFIVCCGEKKNGSHLSRCVTPTEAVVALTIHTGV